MKLHAERLTASRTCALKMNLAEISRMAAVSLTVVVIPVQHAIIYALLGYLRLTDYWIKKYQTGATHQDISTCNMYCVQYTVDSEIKSWQQAKHHEITLKLGHTSGQRNFIKRPHRCHRMAQWYSPHCANVHPASNTCFQLGPTQFHIQNGISTGSAIFAHLMAVCPYTL